MEAVALRENQLVKLNSSYFRSIMIELFSKHLRAVINPMGAELTSLKSIQTDLEYIWQADPAFWGKHSPVLFPIVGSLKNNTYIFEEKSYQLPRHGFARESIFTVEKVNDLKAIFTLTSNAETMKVYPFTFQLQLVYELVDRNLYCTYIVHNPSKKTLWFSIGGHPAFRVPLYAGEQYEDYSLQFNQSERLDCWLLEDGLISHQSKEVPSINGRLPLLPALFYNDALVFKNLQSTQITLANRKNQAALRFLFKGFPYLGIWAAKDAPFVCLEPWCGHADTVAHNQQLMHKPGIEKLESSGHWERRWGVHIPIF